MSGTVGFTPYEMRTSVVKVSSYENKNIKGYLSNPYYEQDVYFDNLTQLLFSLENLLDQLKFPQKAMERRNFGKENADLSGGITSKNLDEGPILASFKINIMFRQNASWQGSIAWMEKAMESQFRSVLELVVLMDSVLAEL